MDAVYLATPHETHYDYVRRALLRGRHVLCEKPMAFTEPPWGFRQDIALCTGYQQLPFGFHPDSRLGRGHPLGIIEVYF